MKLVKFLFSPLFMGILFVVFAISMAAATFLENDLGSSAAYTLVYGAKWFELILLLLSLNLVGQVISLKLLRKEKLPVALFHLSFILMLMGAGITRYFGWEGTIHIRNGQEQQQCFSTDKYLGYSVKNNSGAIIESHSQKYSMTSVSADNFKRTVKINGQEYKLILAKLIPNASESIADSPEGVPVISLIVTNMMGRETLIIKKGETKTSYGITFEFGSGQPADVSISVDSGKFFISSALNLGMMSMMTQQVTNLDKDKPVELKPMQILTVNNIKIVPQQMSLSGVVRAVAVKPEEQTTGLNAFIFHLMNGNKSATVYLWDREEESGQIASASVEFEGNTFELHYGPKTTTLPFVIKLNKFILERYPGSTSPSGYKSDVVIIDKAANVEKPFMIFMNNILKYKGYRFYQSSYDHDEQGTILSVNHDMAGMLVTYSGYALLFFFILLSLLSKNTMFRTITAGHWNSAIRKTVTAFLFILVLSGTTKINAQKLIPDKQVAMEFGKVLVQDQKGRTKPLFTLSNDILRKVTRENKFEGLNSMQVFLGIYLDFKNWKDVPIISISSTDLQKKLGITGKLAAFTDIVNLDNNGTYKISAEVNSAYSKSPSERNKIDKEVMKVDERVNIIYMIYKGDFMKLLPLQDSTHDWVSPQEAYQRGAHGADSLFLGNIIPLLTEDLETNNLTSARQLTESISNYQKKYSQYSLPSESKTNVELLYYRLGIFEKLFPFYATAGLIMLIGLITMLIRGRKSTSLFVQILSSLLFVGFLFHTLGIGMRWYIAGHSPMSNGYESMVFISWATLLAGFIFSRKSAFALSASAVLASMTLMVAHMSFLDPEITNLVPVLKSYWLTLHVSVIISSYGFLGVGAILGLITLILLALSKDNNRDRISDTIDELTVINFKTLTIGLYLLTIGTFLGAIWANESWGRYWGWDPKETWSLITIIIYSIVIHSRRIPGMKDIFTFNLLSLFAFASVLMTYFGVNYYLSGMHSYASGEAASVPSFIYIVVIVLAALSFLAYTKYNPSKK
ncbi:MAG TPA: c-type cytochrome biogenesis protein CcsB [Bacteroidales bacterium]|nr:c-type cytochrome biogenesis protein CcsB [Bacteroidales bacterium]